MIKWKKTKSPNSWINKEREIMLKIGKGKSKQQYPYGVSIHSTYIVAGGDKYLKGFYKKSQALKYAKKYMGK